eukprot:Hpha_TRINITY_DN15513_c5_g7::TRINITY_DN15513_c5_g7_i1::g.107621::m.107621
MSPTLRLGHVAIVTAATPLVFWILYASTSLQPPSPPHPPRVAARGGNDDMIQSATIFVSIAAYRDREATRTVAGLFHRAEHPQRVFVGLVCQPGFGKADEECPTPEEWDKEGGLCWKKGRNETEWCPKDNMRVQRMPAEEAQGPTHARYLAARMLKGEDYFFLIDAHTRFVKGWDGIALRQIRKCASPRCVLTHYPMPYEPDQLDRGEQQRPVSYLCSLASGKDGGSGWTEGYPGPFWSNTYSIGEEPRP